MPNDHQIINTFPPPIILSIVSAEVHFGPVFIVRGRIARDINIYPQMGGAFVRLYYIIGFRVGVLVVALVEVRVGRRVGDLVGLRVVGMRVGALVGICVVGMRVGVLVGLRVGSLVGFRVGDRVGVRVGD